MRGKGQKLQTEIPDCHAGNSRVAGKKNLGKKKERRTREKEKNLAKKKKSRTRRCTDRTQTEQRKLSKVQGGELCLGAKKKVGGGEEKKAKA